MRDASSSTRPARRLVPAAARPLFALVLGALPLASCTALDRQIFFDRWDEERMDLECQIEALCGDDPDVFQCRLTDFSFDRCDRFHDETAEECLMELEDNLADIESATEDTLGVMCERARTRPTPCRLENVVTDDDPVGIHACSLH